MALARNPVAFVIRLLERIFDRHAEKAQLNAPLTNSPRGSFWHPLFRVTASSSGAGKSGKPRDDFERAFRIFEIGWRDSSDTKGPIEPLCSKL